MLIIVLILLLLLSRAHIHSLVDSVEDCLINLVKALFVCARQVIEKEEEKRERRQVKTQAPTPPAEE
jgi:hypothetical protein